MRLFSDPKTFVTLLGGMLESVSVGRTEDDFRMVESVYRELLPGNERFASSDIVTLLERRPDIAAINQRSPR